ncbi:MAG: hypothetical protein PXY39_13150 [archaeon]|jgi:hypothetical protein|nr:hypothetical protein [archaeon]
MPTILVKGVSEDALKRLKKLKVELDCDTWAELLDKLSESDRRVTLTKKEISEMKQGVTEFIALANKVSKKWHDRPTVLEEFRASRKHE